MASNIYEQRHQRTEWFRNARLGMFIHWGLYAIPARGEWIRSFESISNEDYQPFFDEFNPVEYDPVKWANIAKEAGMKYAVLTAKHHDGFCLFDSALTDYKSTNTPAGRDLVKEYVEAFRDAGIKVGLYYSLLDWHHPDYPALDDLYHPMRKNEKYTDLKIDFDSYITYMHGQVRELLTNYGKIDMVWFDFSYEEMSGEKWRAGELVDMMRSIQPEIIMDNRLGGNMLLENPEEYAGDFEGPEQIIPSLPITDELGRQVPWEACITLNNSWGYNSSDVSYKSSGEIIRYLVNCVSKNGNLLVNVGPDARGRIPQQSIDILLELGQWLKINGDSVYGCSHYDIQQPEWGYYTTDGKKLYAHVLHKGVGQINLAGLKSKVKKGRLLRDGSEVFLGPFWRGEEHNPNGKDDIYMSYCKPIMGTYPLPDPIDTVVEFELDGSI